MTARTRLLALLLGLFVAPCASFAQEPAATSPPAPPPFRLDAAKLEEMAKLAQTAVEAECACELTVRIRIATAEEIRTALTEDSLPLLRVQLGNEEAAKAAAKAFAAQIGDAMIAKYWFHHGEVLVNPEALDFTASATGIAELSSEPAALAILVHELVHAADDERYDLSRWIDGVGDMAHIEAANCIIEGHAQQVARRVCRTRGWTAGFETFTRAIAAPPKSGGAAEPALALVSRMLASRITAWYVQGEIFLDAVAADAAPESEPQSVKRLFTAQPPPLEQIYEPRWYLHPELAPKTTVDVKAVLDRLAKRWPADQWTTMQVDVGRAQLEIAFELAPELARKNALATLRSTRVLVVSPVVPDQRQITATVIELDSPPAALALLELEEAVGRAKDEAMKSGFLRIAEATYAALPAGGRRGFVMKKRIAVGELEISATTLVTVADRLLVEIGYVQEPATDDELRAVADELFAAARPDAAPAAGAAPTDVAAPVDKK